MDSVLNTILNLLLIQLCESMFCRLNSGHSEFQNDGPFLSSNATSDFGNILRSHERARALSLATIRVHLCPLYWCAL